MNRIACLMLSAVLAVTTSLLANTEGVFDWVAGTELVALDDLITIEAYKVEKESDPEELQLFLDVQHFLQTIAYQITESSTHPQAARACAIFDKRLDQDFTAYKINEKTLQANTFSGGELVVVDQILAVSCQRAAEEDNTPLLNYLLMARLVLLQQSLTLLAASTHPDVAEIQPLLLGRLMQCYAASRRFMLPDQETDGGAQR